MVFLAPQQHCLGRAPERSRTFKTAIKEVGTGRRCPRTHALHFAFRSVSKLSPIRSLALFASLILAAGVRSSYNSNQDTLCDQIAVGACDTGSGPDYDIAYSHCMASYWKTITTNKNCPHPKVNCLCYNGCFSDRSGIVRDVGGWCTTTCRQALQTSPCH
ncbi:hypothetical protein V8E36_005128, partial [Tilletia maclaganii]